MRKGLLQVSFWIAITAMAGSCTIKSTDDDDDNKKEAAKGACFVLVDSGSPDEFELCNDGITEEKCEGEQPDWVEGLTCEEENFTKSCDDGFVLEEVSCPDGSSAGEEGACLGFDDELNDDICREIKESECTGDDEAFREGTCADNGLPEACGEVYVEEGVCMEEEELDGCILYSEEFGDEICWEGEDWGDCGERDGEGLKGETCADAGYTVECEDGSMVEDGVDCPVYTLGICIYRDSVLDDEVCYEVEQSVCYYASIDSSDFEEEWIEGGSCADEGFTSDCGQGLFAKEGVACEAE